ncbi:uncharacterized protein LOC105220193 isoform X2 [Zeugodacus cucurbitae]|uniref:uncharacterized protein LOC105220193 isoform X2 n=1 Tax=Zeugodacus cucurbitae TaxID=28588 RepID=UPI000596A040|nr:uncharacterized protein LOC105220193 isoform X2 [Zeugodacus cucurbitae]
MHLLWLISSIGLSLLHLQLTQCNDLELLRIGIAGSKNENKVGNNGQFNGNSGLNGNDLASINTNNTMMATVFNGGITTSKDIIIDTNFGDTNMGVSVNSETGLGDHGSIKIGESELPLSAVPGLGHNPDLIPTGQFRGYKQIKSYGQQYGHALAGLANLGIIIPKGSNNEDFSRNNGGGRKMQTKVDSEINLMDPTNISGSNGGQNSYLKYPDPSCKIRCNK